MIDKLILAAGIAASSFGAGWLANGWRLNGKIAEIRQEQAQANAAAQAQARAKEQALNKQLQEAQHAAIERENKLRADADAARATAGSLRNALAEFRRQLPSLTREAVERYADAASVVFGECTAEYQRLAEQADRIDSDRKRLEDAWPKP